MACWSTGRPTAWACLVDLGRLDLGGRERPSGGIARKTEEEPIAELLATTTTPRGALRRLCSQTPCSRPKICETRPDGGTPLTTHLEDVESWCCGEPGNGPGSSAGIDRAIRGGAGVALPDNFDMGELDEPTPPNAGRLWVGGIATAVVAALVVVAGVFIARGILGIPVLAPKGASSLGDSST